MENKEFYLYKCISYLEIAWESHFRLHCYWIGYITADILVTLLSIWRISEPCEFKDLPEEELISLLEEKIYIYNRNSKQRIYSFPYDKDFNTVLPKLINTLEHFDLSESNISQGQWEKCIENIFYKRNGKI